MRLSSELCPQGQGREVSQEHTHPPARGDQYLSLLGWWRLVEAGRRQDFWGMLGHQGKLPGGGGFSGQALGSRPFPVEKSLRFFVQRPVEASWGKEGLGHWGWGLGCCGFVDGR